MAGMAIPDIAVAESKYPPRSQAVWALLILMLANIFSFIDRNVFVSLVPPIKADLGISDTAISFLIGGSFGLFYSIMALPCGLLIDRMNRRNLVAFAIVLWSCATVWCGLANSYAELFAARVTVGVGEAVLMPAAFSLLADFFPLSKRGRMIGIFAFSAYLGGGSAYIASGAVLSVFGAQNHIIFPFIGVLPVWKAAFIMVGVPGFLVSLLLLTIKEPARLGARILITEGADKGKEYDKLAPYMKKHWRPFFYVWGTYTLMTLAAFAINPWISTMLARRFDTPLSEILIITGLMNIVPGVAGCVIGGIWGDRWTREDKRGSKLRLLCIMWIAWFPTVLAFALINNAYGAALSYGVFFFFNALAYGATGPVIQDMVPRRLRGRAGASWYLITGVIGQGLGPVSAGVVTNYVFHNEALLNYSIITIAIPCAVVGLWMAWRGLEPYDALRREVAAAEMATLTSEAA